MGWLKCYLIFKISKFSYKPHKIEKGIEENILKGNIVSYLISSHLLQDCADAITLAPPLTMTPYAPSARAALLFQTASFFSLSKMAAAVANKCLSPLAFLTRRLSAPEFISQCCYHKKVKRLSTCKSSFAKGPT